MVVKVKRDNLQWHMRGSMRTLGALCKECRSDLKSRLFVQRMMREEKGLVGVGYFLEVF